MSVSNPWLTPYQRSFNDIKAKLIQSLRSRLPEITDFTEGNIFIVILSIWAAMAEVLHYYIDNMGRETFVTTARRYSSLYKHAQLVDYRIKSATAASVDLVLFRKNREAVETDIIIQEGTIFESNDNKKWVVTKNYIWPANSTNVVISVTQKEIYPKTILGNYTENHQAIYLGDLPTGQKYVDGTMVARVNNEPWTLVESFSKSTPYSKVYRVEVDQNQKPYIKFGDGFFGRQPDYNSEISAEFYLTYGKDSNIPENSFSRVPDVLTTIYDDIQVNNPSKALGGSDYESFTLLKNRIPLSIRTLDVAITKEDYEALAMLHPQVDKAYVNYLCGRSVEVYITTKTEDGVGGITPEAIIADVTKYLSNKKVLTTSIQVKTTYPISIYIKATVTGKPSFSALDIKSQVTQALIDNYNYNTSDIYKAIRLSDLYALVDNQSMVDYLKIDALYFIPTPQDWAINGTNKLIVAKYVQSSYVSTYQTGMDEPEDPGYIRLAIQITSGGNKYRVTYAADGVNNVGSVIEGHDMEHEFGKPYSFNLKKADSKNINRYISANIELTLSNSGTSYLEGDVYGIYIQPMNQDIEPEGYTIPIFSSENIELTINETV